MLNPHDSQKPALDVASIRSSPPFVSTIREAGIFLSLSERTVRSLIARGHLKCKRIGRIVRIPRSALERFASVEG